MAVNQSNNLQIQAKFNSKKASGVNLYFRFFAFNLL